MTKLSHCVNLRTVLFGPLQAISNEHAQLTRGTNNDKNQAGLLLASRQL